MSISLCWFFSSILVTFIHSPYVSFSAIFTFLYLLEIYLFGILSFIFFHFIEFFTLSFLRQLIYLIFIVRFSTTFYFLHSSFFLWVAFCICLTFTPFTFLYKTFFLFFLILTGHMLEISFSFVFDNFSKVLKKYNFLIQGIHNIFSYPLNKTS